MPNQRSSQSARRVVHEVLSAQADAFPNMPPKKVETTGLSPDNKRLAIALHQTVLQRWLTLEYLLNQYLKKPLDQLEPHMQAVLLSGTAQIIFMHSIPSHAAVDESVHIAHRKIRPGAAKLTNAILRRISEIQFSISPDTPWTAQPHTIPYESGHITFHNECFPTDQRPQYLALATSHPQVLVEAWLKQFGAETTLNLLTHSLKTPPVILHCENQLPTHLANLQPHEHPNAYLWDSTQGDLAEVINHNEHIYVQDPTANKVASVTKNLTPQLIIDYCAGRGTKTRQLAKRHPNTTIVATDYLPTRVESLRTVFQQTNNVTVVPFHELSQFQNKADLILLDVPCSNTGVLARRTEARYRYSHQQMKEITQLQRQVIQQATPLLKHTSDNTPNASILYSTCSIDHAENQRLAKWITRELNLQIQTEEQTLPTGLGPTYHDGGYYALLTPP